MKKKKDDGLFTLGDLEQDRCIFRKLKIVLTFIDRMWILDSNGDYGIYHQSLRILAKRYGLDMRKMHAEKPR